MTQEEVEEDQVVSTYDLENALEGQSAPDTTGTAVVRGHPEKERGQGKSPYRTQLQSQSCPRAVARIDVRHPHVQTSEGSSNHA